MRHSDIHFSKQLTLTVPDRKAADSLHHWQRLHGLRNPSASLQNLAGTLFQHHNPPIPRFDPLSPMSSNGTTIIELEDDPVPGLDPLSMMSFSGKKIKDLEEQVEKWQKIAGHAFGMTWNAVQAQRARDVKGRWDKLQYELETAPSAQKALPLLHEAIGIHEQVLEAEKQYKGIAKEHLDLCMKTANMLSMKEYKVLEHWRTVYQNEREERRLTDEERKKEKAATECINKQLNTMLKRTATCMDDADDEKQNEGEVSGSSPGKRARPGQVGQSMDPNALSVSLAA